MDDSEENCKEDKRQTSSHRQLDFDNVIDVNTTEEDESGNESLENEVMEPVEGNDILNNVHLKIRKEMIPVIGMEFDTEDDAYKFYNAYAYEAGFSVRRSKFHKNKDLKFMDRLFVCSVQGYRENDKRFRNVKAHRAETRCGCQACMKIKHCKVTDKYRVVKFVFQHNGHVTTSPSKSQFFRSHRSIADAQLAEADLAYDSGIDPKATFEFLSRQAGGRENLGFIPDDYKNYLRSKRTRQMKVGDTGGVLEYLQKKQLDDPNFFYAIQVDADSLITNIFWADTRMRVDYDYFGDVMCFDTTYRKNKDGRPFAMFVGVNHHKQTVIFGAALLYDETSETFMWLFDTFEKAMSGKKPKTILTDQDAAMAKALGSQWPETCHRLCIWHIYQNAAKHLSSVFDKFSDFAEDFSSCIYDYEEEDEFLSAWSVMLQKYNLIENDWLKRMFDLKEKWALVYGRQTFCADITTTQRSESMNSSLKKYVNYKFDLLRFFHHFERLVEDRRYNELRADFKASQSVPAMSFPVKLLIHAAEVYTPNVFRMFEYQLCRAHDCIGEFIEKTGTVSKYKVFAHEKSWRHSVTFDSTNDCVQCSCKKFEFAGILCRHALKVLCIKNIQKIPTQYILKRWRKDVKEGKRANLPCGNSESMDPKAEYARQYRDICRLQIQLATRAAPSKKAYELVMSRLDSIFKEVDACFKEESGQKPTQEISPVTDGASELNELNNVDEDLNRVKGIKVKERPTGVGCSTRPKNVIEKLTTGKRRKAGTKETNSSTCSSICAPTTTCVSTTEHVPQLMQCVPTTPTNLPLRPSISTLRSTLPMPQSTMHSTLPLLLPHTQDLHSPSCSSMNFQVNMPYVVPPYMPLRAPVQFPQQHNLGAYNTISNYEQWLQRPFEPVSVRKSYSAETGERMLQSRKQI